MKSFFALVLGSIILFHSHGQNELNSNLLQFCNEPITHYKKIDFNLCKNSKSDSFSFGICWSKEPNPSIFNSFYIFQNESAEFKYSINNLAPNTDYYVSLFQIFTDGKVNYYSSLYLTTLPELKLGQEYQGGIIVYLFKAKDSLYVENEQHGMILSKENLGYAVWGLHGKVIEAGTSHKLGFGKRNTQNIVAQYGAASSNFSYNGSNGLKIIHPCAAVLCSNYSIDGWTDWFLPSKEDWNIFFGNLEFLEHLQLSYVEGYWSSSEVFISFSLSKKRRKETKSQFKRAWQVQFQSKIVQVSTMSPKSNSALVRAMRYF